MSITLYELSSANVDQKFSPHCWKSHLALVHKGLSFSSVAVAFGEKHKIAFSGQKLVPVLQDDNNAINDSWEIACYLEEHYPSHKSLFIDEAGKALAQSINHWCDTVLAAHIRPLVLMGIYQTISEEDKVYFRESREAKLGMSLEEYAATADSALQHFREELNAVRELLNMQPYLGGQQVSYADLCLLGMFLWIACINDLVFLEKDDVVYQWYLKMLDDYSVTKQVIEIV